ncbi:hypothetical protein CYMTET_11186 [Cymbomonas tetramitiformis]|uniref:Uncharacterized protein n=1 Tax=Cymbomonas tetramitiformis TaxID=36881 RepID=A0AAE0GN79_9CHLO|nr:hypothetical protein CYMTET_11186 [Cymbomonas tetramitiformis]
MVNEVIVIRRRRAAHAGLQRRRAAHAGLQRRRAAHARPGDAENVALGSALVAAVELVGLRHARQGSLLGKAWWMTLQATEREPGPEACWGSAEERKLAGHRMVKRSRFCGLRMEQCTISSSSGCHGCHNKAVVRTVRGGPLSTRAVRRASTLFHTKPAAGGCEGLPVTPFQAAIQWGCTIQCGHCFEQILPTNGTKAAHESGPHWEG